MQKSRTGVPHVTVCITVRDDGSLKTSRPRLVGLLLDFDFPRTQEMADVALWLFPELPLGAHSHMWGFRIQKSLLNSCGKKSKARPI